MNWTRRKFLKSSIFLGLSAIILDSLFFERFFVEVNEFILGSATKANPDIKVIQVSDLHLNSLSFYHKTIAKKINLMQPDLIVITGDAVDKSLNINLLDYFLNLIKRDIQKVAILGNWEYWGKINLNELKNIYLVHNCDLLINESRQYTFKNKTISVTGLDDFVGGNADIKKAVMDYKKSDYHLVLNHCPEYSDIIPLQINRRIAIDLILSGHTHGGQINIFGIIPFLPQGSGKYVKGWYKDEYKNLYVSKGIGTSLLPIRFGARAEIAVFNLWL